MRSKLKTSKTPNKPDERSIYDIIKHQIDVPEGLQYRGKYCAKSKVREETMQYENEFGRLKDSDLRSSVTIKKRPKSSFNTSNKKSKSRRDNDLFSTFHKENMKDSERNVIRPSVTQENLANDPIYQYTPEDYFNLCGYPYKNID